MPFSLIYIAMSSVAGRDAVWNTFVTKFDYFKDEFKSSFMIGRLMKSVISTFDSHDKIDEVEKFAKANPIDSAKRAVEQGETLLYRPSPLDINNENCCSNDDFRCFLT